MVTRRPRAFSSRPRLEAVSPLPRLEATPPVTKTWRTGLSGALLERANDGLPQSRAPPGTARSTGVHGNTTGAAPPGHDTRGCGRRPSRRQPDDHACAMRATRGRHSLPRLQVEVYIHKAIHHVVRR